MCLYFLRKNKLEFGMKIKAEFCGIRLLGHIITENKNKRVPGSIDYIVKMLN